MNGQRTIPNTASTPSTPEFPECSCLVAQLRVRSSEVSTRPAARAVHTEDVSAVLYSSGKLRLVEWLPKARYQRMRQLKTEQWLMVAQDFQI